MKNPGGRPRTDTVRVIAKLSPEADAKLKLVASGQRSRFMSDAILAFKPKNPYDYFTVSEDK